MREPPRSAAWSFAVYLGSVGAVAAPAAIAQVDHAALVGGVVDPDGAPVADAKVEVFQCAGRGRWHLDRGLRDEWLPVASTRVDKAGRFGVQVPLGLVLRVQVQHPRFALWRVDEHVLDQELRIVLQPPSTFRGRLVDAAGAGVTGTLVGLWSEVTKDFAGRTEIFRGRTDANGAFELTHLPAGPFTCIVEPDRGAVPSWWKGTLAPGTPCETTFTLAAGRTVRGTVVDAANGTPIADARVGEHWLLQRPTATGPDGTFVLAGVGAAATELRCVADGYVAALADVAAGGEPGAQDFRLQRGDAVAGRIVDPRGKPAAGVHVAAVADGRVPTWLATRTGPDGTFRVAGLPPESSPYLVLRAPGFAYVVYHLTMAKADGRYDAGELALQPGHLVRAAVRTEDGKPVVGARMLLCGINADMEKWRGGPLGWAGLSQLGERWGYTDAHGVVCIGDVAPGRYELGFHQVPQPLRPVNAVAVEVTPAGAPKDLVVTR